MSVAARGDPAFFFARPPGDGAEGSRRMPVLCGAENSAMIPWNNHGMNAGARGSNPPSAIQRHPEKPKGDDR